MRKFHRRASLKPCKLAAQKPQQPPLHILLVHHEIFETSGRRHAMVSSQQQYSSQNNVSVFHGVFVRIGCGAELDTQLHSELICPARGAAALFAECILFLCIGGAPRCRVSGDIEFLAHTGHETQKCVCPTDVSPPPREAFN